MPLCLIQSLPGTVRRITDGLSVVVPDESCQMPHGIPPFCHKDVREGRCAWHIDGVVTDEPASIDELAAQCIRWREKGLFSFIEIQGSLNGAEESVQRLAHAVDWLVIDGSKKMEPHSGELAIEQWGRLAGQLRQLTRKAGLRLSLDDSIPEEALRPWIAQVALQLGEPGFIFVEGASFEKSVAVIRGVQDLLSRHSMSKGSARLMPIVRPEEHSLGDSTLELLDLPSLDALVIESARPFFGGVAVAKGGGEALFGLSLWQAVVNMVSGHHSAASLCRVKGVSQTHAADLIGAIYALALAIQREDCREALARLEKIFGEIDRGVVFRDENVNALKSRIDALIAQAQKAVGQKSPKRSVFGLW